MKHDRLLARIVRDPHICHGRPCVRGHRVWVSLILDLLADGASFDDILAHYPGLERDDIRACIAYAAELSRDRLLGECAQGVA